mgnify:CR=1 FL=1
MLNRAASLEQPCIFPREIGESEGTGESEAGHSVRSGIRRMRRYFIQQKWLKAQKEENANG